MQASPSVAHEAKNCAQAHLNGLLERLRAEGDVLEEDLKRALRVAEKSGSRIDQVLPSLGLLSEERLSTRWAEVLQTAYIRADRFPQKPLLNERIDPKFLHAHAVLPLADDETGVSIAMADPLDDFAADAIAFELERSVKRVIATPTDIRLGLERLYPKDEAVPAPSDDEVVALHHEEPDSGDLERLRDLASDAPVVQWVNGLMAGAIEARASDIHLEPDARGLRVRRRIDGILVDIAPPPNTIARAACSRIKIMAKLDIAEQRLPQDGRCSTTVRGRDIDLRIASAPTLRGETLVMRILDQSRAPLDLGALGYNDDAAGALRQLLGLPNGIILVTGPTGSGKTTTLYAALRELAAPDRKLMSVEDPIEYELEGITQLQIKPGIGLTFARALRSFLRHDPDIVMVGEIRDRETAEVAIEAALTGHLVLSTLHTNSAAGAVTRLAEMGVPNYLLAASLTGVLAQRLVRRLCTNCAQSDDLTSVQMEELGFSPDDRLAAVNRPRDGGCERCNGTGYRGRTCIAEVLPVSDPVRALVLAGGDEATLAATAERHGMRRLFDDGLAKVRAGETSLDEVLRVAKRGSS